MEIFNKIGETITSTGKDIAKKAKDIVDVNTVKANINEQKRVIRKAYERIGEAYYKNHVDLGEHDYEIEFETVGEANAKLKELYEQLNTLRKVCVCPECGATLPDDSEYCNKCGKKLQKKVVDVEVDEEQAEAFVNDESDHEN